MFQSQRKLLHIFHIKELGYTDQGERLNVSWPACALGGAERLLQKLAPSLWHRAVWEMDRISPGFGTHCWFLRVLGLREGTSATEWLCHWCRGHPRCAYCVQEIIHCAVSEWGCHSGTQRLQPIQTLKNQVFCLFGLAFWRQSLFFLRPGLLKIHYVAQDYRWTPPCLTRFALLCCNS